MKINSGIKILMADDDPISLMIIPKMLRKFGLHADTAANGEEVIAMHGQVPYDCILMDVSMPQMDGISASEYIRSQDGLKDLNVVIIGVTGHDSDEDRAMCLAAGMNDVLVKPYELESLIEKINANLNSRQV